MKLILNGNTRKPEYNMMHVIKQVNGIDIYIYFFYSFNGSNSILIREKNPSKVLIKFKGRKPKIFLERNAPLQGSQTFKD